MGKLITRFISIKNKDNVAASVIIGNTTENCEVEEDVTNEGVVKVQVDGKTTLKIEDTTKYVTATNILHKAKITQT